MCIGRSVLTGINKYVGRFLVCVFAGRFGHWTFVDVVFGINLKDLPRIWLYRIQRP